MTMRRSLPCLLWGLPFVAELLWGLPLVASTTVDVRLRGSWEHVAPAQEHFEFIKEVAEKDAIEYLRRAFTTGSASGFFSDGSVDKFASLLAANHYHSPRVEMMRSIERGHRLSFLGSGEAGGLCPQFWLLFSDGSGTCSLMDLYAHGVREKKERAAGKAHHGFPSTDFDLAIPAVEGKQPAVGSESLPTVILYADLGRIIGGAAGAGEAGAGTLRKMRAGALKPSLLFSAEDSGTKAREAQFAKVYAPGTKDLPGVDVIRFLEEEVSPFYRVVFRHAGSASEGSGDADSGPSFDLLAGYGIRLRIKNTEYKASAEEDDASESQDIRWSRDLGTDYVDYLKYIERNATKSASSPSESSSASSSDILALLKDVTSDFPEKSTWLHKQLKSELGRRPTKKDRRGEEAGGRYDGGDPDDDGGDPDGFPARRAMGVVRQRIGTAPGQTMVTFNRRVLIQPSHSNLGIYPILKMLVPQFVAMERLSRLRLLSREELLGVFHRPVVTKPVTRLDFWGMVEGPEAIPSIYSVLSCPKTRAWSAEPEAVLRQQQHGGMMAMFGMGGPQLPEIRQPLVYCVVSFDPLSEAQVAAAFKALKDLQDRPGAVSLHYMVGAEEGRAGKDGFDGVLKRLEGQTEDAGGVAVTIPGGMIDNDKARLQHRMYLTGIREAVKNMFSILLLSGSSEQRCRKRAQVFLKDLAQNEVYAQLVYRYSKTLQEELSSEEDAQKEGDNPLNDREYMAEMMQLMMSGGDPSAIQAEMENRKRKPKRVWWTIETGEKEAFPKMSVLLDAAAETRIVVNPVEKLAEAKDSVMTPESQLASYRKSSSDSDWVRVMRFLRSVFLARMQHKGHKDFEEDELDAIWRDVIYRRVVEKLRQEFPVALPGALEDQKEGKEGKAKSVSKTTDFPHPSAVFAPADSASLPAPATLVNGKATLGMAGFSQLSRELMGRQVEAGEMMRRGLMNRIPAFAEYTAHKQNEMGLEREELVKKIREVSQQTVRKFLKMILGKMLPAHHEAISPEAVYGEDEGEGGGGEGDQQGGPDAQGGKDGASSASEGSKRKFPWVFQDLVIPQEAEFLRPPSSAGATEEADAPAGEGVEKDGDDDGEEGSGRRPAAPNNGFFHLPLLMGEGDLYVLDLFRASTGRKTRYLPLFGSEALWERFGSPLWCLVVRQEAGGGAARPPSLAEVRRLSGEQSPCTGPLGARLAALKEQNFGLARELLSAEDGKLRTVQMKRVLAKKVREAESAGEQKSSKQLQTALSGATLRWWCNGRVVEVSGEHMPPLQAAHVAAMETVLPELQDIGSAAGALDSSLAQANAIANSMYNSIEEPVTDSMQRVWEVYPEELRMELRGSEERAGAPGAAAAVPVLKINAICDPLSGTMQQLSQLLVVLDRMFPIEIRLMFNPVMETTEAPLREYYREVIYTGQEREHESEPGSGSLHALEVQRKNVLTLALEVPPTWLVSALEAEADFDNLPVNPKKEREESKDGKGELVHRAVFRLESLYMEGQAFIQVEDSSDFGMFWGEPPAAGVELGLYGSGGGNGPGGELALRDDARVLQNHGYFQLAGNPGMYSIRLLPETEKKYDLVSTPFLTVDSYITPPYQVKVKEKPDYKERRKVEALMEMAEEKEQMDMYERRQAKAAQHKLLETGVLTEEQVKELTLEHKVRKARRGAGGEAPGSIISRLLPQWLVGKGTELETTTEQPNPDRSPMLGEVHIFTVASGHLYEKLLAIMITSVRKHTKSRLHFWFLDSFLSPRFKRLLPALAEKLDFRFNFVSYKWPSWLNPQSEKQRLIWAYKILFLDVLFPLDVKKIIFIDADQVVRADVQELADIDLQGKVYGFVPMGDSNKATEGFRFWKQGYWAGHLQGKPYFISALFVVDLERYRKESGGDGLRGIYNQLSRDPNSLANLDQDLPNFAQHQLPIFELPKEWLFCETWCDTETELAKAKTIDLCQNPLTKEPKLQMARRIAPEWGDYHDFVVRLQEEFEGRAAAAPRTGTRPAATTGAATIEAAALRGKIEDEEKGKDSTTTGKPGTQAESEEAPSEKEL